MQLLELYNGILAEEKILAYHGSPNGKFSSFNIKYRGSGADKSSFGDYGKGFYFTPNRKKALGFAKNVPRDKGKPKPTLYTVALTMKKPFDMQLFKKIRDENTKLVKKYGNIFKIPEEAYDKMISDLGLTPKEYDFYMEIESLIGDNWGDWDIGEKLKEHGFDSLINYDGTEFVVYNSSQISIRKVEQV